MLIATFRLDFDAVALERAFTEAPDMAIEAERIAAHGTKWTMPCLWIAAADFDAVDEALATDPSVKEIVESDEFSDEKYYHLDWSDDVKERIDTYVGHEGSVLQAEATDDGWEIEFRFVSREQFDEFRMALREQGHSFELVNLYEPGSPRRTADEVTAAQRDALVTAVERGYYKVPRTITTRELAEELDVSHQSLSETLRRGTENLVAFHLMAAGDSERTRAGDFDG